MPHAQTCPAALCPAGGYAPSEQGPATAWYNGTPPHLLGLSFFPHKTLTAFSLESLCTSALARARALWSLDRPMSIHHNTYINRTDHPVSKQRSAETEKPSSPRTPRFSVRPIFEDISCCRRRAQRLRPNASGKTFMSARRPNVICPGAWPCSLAPPQAQLLQDVGENAPRHAPAPRAARRSPSFCARAFDRSFRKCCAGRRSHRLRVGGSQL